RRGGSDQPLMVEKGTAIGRVEEPVTQSVLLRELSLRQRGGIEVAQDQARVIAPRDKLIQVASLGLQDAVINLELLMIKAMNEIARFRVRRDVRGEVVGNERQRQQLCCREGQLPAHGRELGIDSTVVEGCWSLVDEAGVAGRLLLLGQGVEAILQ